MYTFYACSEWTAGYVRVPGILDCDEIVSRGHRSVREFVAFFNLVTAELDFGGSVDCDSQGTGTSVHCVDDELAQLAYQNNGLQLSWKSFKILQIQRQSRHNP